MISDICRAQFEEFMGQSPEKLVSQYCTTVSNKFIVVLGIVALMWLLEPKIRKAILKWDYDNGFINSESLIWIYKTVGIGMIFLVGYGIWMI